MHEKYCQCLGTNLIDWKKSAAAKIEHKDLELTQWLRKSIAMVHKIWYAQKKNWKSETKFGKSEKSEICESGTKFGNSKIQKRIRKFGNEFGKSEIRKRIRKVGNSEIRKRIRKMGNSEIRKRIRKKQIRRLTGFRKMFGKSDLLPKLETIGLAKKRFGKNQIFGND